MPNLSDLSIDTRVLGFTVLISVLSGLLFGLVPALQSSEVSLKESLKEGSRSSGGPGGHRIRSLLVISELALALVLLAGTGLVIQSLRRLLEVHPGFASENLLAMNVALPAARYSQNAQVISFYERLQQRVASLPAVKAAALIDELPVTHDGGTVRLLVEGRPEPPPGQEQESVIRSASPGYIEVMGIPLLRGRFFTEEDNASAPLTAVLSETLARRLFPAEDPIGRRIVLQFNRSVLRIVGVVADVRMAGLDRAVRPAFYTCSLQDPSPGSHIVIRSAAEPGSLAAAVRREVHAVDPELPVYGVRTMKQAIANSSGVSLRRSVVFLLGGFAVLASLLAAIGLYGVMSYTVTQRTREIGVRMSVGAQQSDVLRLMLRQGLTLTIVGVSAGLAGALAMARVLETVLFGISATDPVTFAAVSLLLVAVALLACYVPARRAARLDPAVALRRE